MNFLEKHKKSKTRLNVEDVIMYEPTPEQRVELIEIINSTAKYKDNEEVEIEMDYSIIRYIISELCKDGEFAKELSDDELIDLIESGDRVITLLVREIKKLVGELVEDIVYNQIESLETINKTLEIIKVNKETEKIKEEMGKMLKTAGIEATIDEILDKKTELKTS